MLIIVHWYVYSDIQGGVEFSLLRHLRKSISLNLMCRPSVNYEGYVGLHFYFFYFLMFNYEM